MKNGAAIGKPVDSSTHTSLSGSTSPTKLGSPFDITAEKINLRLYNLLSQEENYA